MIAVTLPCLRISTIESTRENAHFRSARFGQLSETDGARWAVDAGRVFDGAPEADGDPCCPVVGAMMGLAPVVPPELELFRAGPPALEPSEPAPEPPDPA